MSGGVKTVGNGGTIHLYTAGTPNGIKISIALEELYAANLISGYTFQGISFDKQEQKQPWFLEINPNGRIPAITDKRTNGKPINVWESGSILLYLAKNYDKDFLFHFKDDDEEQELLNWVFFLQGGLGPMQGQLNHFFRYAPESIPYAVKRYRDEVTRLYSVYEEHLKDREYLVGAGKGKYSYADIVTYGWANAHAWAGISFDDFPNVEAWVERIRARPAVKAGRDVPTPRKVLTKEEEEEQIRQIRENFNFK